MKADFEQRLYDSSKEQLLLLLKELAMRHPVLLSEMSSILDNLSGMSSNGQDIDEEVTEDWDFSGDELTMVRPFPQALPLPIASKENRQSVEEFAVHLRQEQSPQGIAKILGTLVEEAIEHIGQNDSSGALDLFALLLDERLRNHLPEVTAVYDEYIDAAFFSLEPLLTEASSDTMFPITSSPRAALMTAAVRHQWLERLLALWLKRLEAHKMEEDVPEIILNTAWSEDTLFLRSLIQTELKKQPRNEHANIVDFSWQYRTKALENFLKELVRT